jgi:hypothetical protein
MLCLSPSNIAGGIFKSDSVAAYYPIDRNQKTEANADRHHRRATVGEKWQRHADDEKDPEHHGNVDSQLDKNQRTNADRQHVCETLPRWRGRYFSIRANCSAVISMPQIIAHLV